MEHFIDSITILEKIPIKDYTIVSRISQCLGIVISFSAIILLLVIYRSQKQINLNDKPFKIILITYAIGILACLISFVPISIFYKETGNYKYKCILKDEVLANDIVNNFEIVNVENNIWTLKDKE